jgi:hypothetical protein
MSRKGDEVVSLAHGPHKSDLEVRPVGRYGLEEDSKMKWAAGVRKGEMGRTRCGGMG